MRTLSCTDCKNARRGAGCKLGLRQPAPLGIVSIRQARAFCQELEVEITGPRS